MKFFQCDLCDKRFSEEKMIQGHKLYRHDPKKPMKCSICHYTFLDLTHLRRHNLKYHKENLSCEICKKSFSIDKDLSDHMECKHNSSKIFQCDSCNYTFDTSRDLQKHINVSRIQKLEWNVQCTAVH